MSVSVQYQKYLSNKLSQSVDSSNYYLLCLNSNSNFAIPMDMLKSLILWQKPKPVYPMPRYVLGFILIGQIATTVVSLENIENSIFYNKPSNGGIYYKYIVSIKSKYQMGIAIQNCQIALAEDLENAMILNQEWLKNNLFNIL